MKEYLVLLRGGDVRMANLTEQETVTHMAKWNVYMQNLAEKGHLTGGMPLQQETKVVSNEGISDEVIRSQAGEVIGGYLLFKAENYDQAAKLAKDCPILEHNGNIEIREIAPMEM